MSHGSAPTAARRPPTSRIAGMSIVEVSFGATLLAFIVGGVTSSFWTVQAAFDEQVVEADLELKSRAAMDRLVRLASTALTTDVEFSLPEKKQKPGRAKVVNNNKKVVEEDVTVNSSPSLEFREILGLANGEPVYDDELKYLLLGPESVTPVQGVIIGRGPDPDSVTQAASGSDGILGTHDDEFAEFVAGTPAVEVLLPGDFTPRDGEMLEFTTVDGTDERLVTITLRVNLQRPDGSWLLESDLVLQERVALRW
jgi:hypothetical protein